MGWFLLILVLIAAALGILSAVLKLAATIILAIVVVVVVIALVGWFGFKHWVKDMERQARENPDGTATYRRSGQTYDVQGWIHEGPAEPQDPPPKLPGDPSE